MVEIAKDLSGVGSSYARCAWQKIPGGEAVHIPISQLLNCLLWRMQPFPAFVPKVGENWIFARMQTYRVVREWSRFSLHLLRFLPCAQEHEPTNVLPYIAPEKGCRYM